MNRIDAMFRAYRSEGRRALIPFVTAGDPDLATTAALLLDLPARGASLIEVGIPYSDPIADGPVIAASYTRALGRGVRLDDIFETIRGVRVEGNSTPLLTMVSYAIVHRRGTERYLADAVEAGLDGLIVPDLPVEEAAGLARLVAEHDLRLVQLVTPTTPRDRTVEIARTSSGFLYYVSVTGITGERRSLPPDLADNVGWLRTRTDLPICIGFGVGSPEQVRELAEFADGIIVGSALVRRLAESADRPRDETVRTIGEFVAGLAEGLRPVQTS